MAGLLLSCLAATVATVTRLFYRTNTNPICGRRAKSEDGLSLLATIGPTRADAHADRVAVTRCDWHDR
jgi:hypothetical protein